MSYRNVLGDEWLNDVARSIGELMDTLRGNLEKVVQHDKRADAIVKNMLLSLARRLRRASLVDINACRGSLNLAYHG